VAMALPQLALGSPPGFDLCVYFVVYDLVAFAERPGASQPDASGPGCRSFAEGRHRSPRMGALERSPSRDRR
jgi:hypothetical protein